MVNRRKNDTDIMDGIVHRPDAGVANSPLGKMFDGFGDFFKKFATILNYFLGGVLGITHPDGRAYTREDVDIALGNKDENKKPAWQKNPWDAPQAQPDVVDTTRADAPAEGAEKKNLATSWYQTQETGGTAENGGATDTESGDRKVTPDADATAKPRGMGPWP